MTVKRQPSSPDSALEASNGAVPGLQSQAGVREPARVGLECSIGIMAYNEEANIAHALDSILRQKLISKRITEIIVVASGCEDRTASIVTEVMSREPRVRLIEQARREGKASAINLFINAAKSSVLAMVSADVVVADDALDALLGHFEESDVGMVGGHPLPVNSDTTFLGHAVQLQWRLHDRIARAAPKMGEMVAFRDVVPSIPLDTAVDEVSIQALVLQLGYRVVYEPRAVVYNRGPATIRDFLRQRRRIFAGHLRVREQQAYSASTMSVWRAFRALLRSSCFRTPREALWSIGTIGLEATARALGWYDVTRRRHSPFMWEMCGTTKKHIADAVNSHRQHNVAVFHIVNFHRLQLEIGVHASRQFSRRVADGIKRDLGPSAGVSTQQAGTFVVLLPGTRESAERAAAELVERFDTAPSPLAGQEMATQVSLACGIVAFSQAGPPLSRSISASQEETDPEPSAAR